MLVTAALASPALGQAEIPIRDYYCHDVYNVPLGIFSITGASTYAWQTVATVDFKGFKDDPSNGPGTYSLTDDGILVFTGPFADQWEASARFGGTSFVFANNFGVVMRCGVSLN